MTATRMTTRAMHEVPPEPATAELPAGPGPDERREARRRWQIPADLAPIDPKTVTVDPRIRWHPLEVRAFAHRVRSAAGSRAEVYQLCEEARIANPNNTEVHDLLERFKAAGSEDEVLSICEGISPLPKKTP